MNMKMLGTNENGYSQDGLFLDLGVWKERMRKVMTFVFLGWILWTSDMAFVGGKSTGRQPFFPQQGFETRKNCMLEAKEHGDPSPGAYQQPIKLPEKGSQTARIFSCFPSDFDPRPRYGDEKKKGFWEMGNFWDLF